MEKIGWDRTYKVVTDSFDKENRKRLFIGTVPTYTVVTDSFGIENRKRLFIGTVVTESYGK